MERRIERKTVARVRIRTHGPLIDLFTRTAPGQIERAIHRHLGVVRGERRGPVLRVRDPFAGSVPVDAREHLGPRNARVHAVRRLGLDRRINPVRGRNPRRNPGVHGKRVRNIRSAEFRPLIHRIIVPGALFIEKDAISARVKRGERFLLQRRVLEILHLSENGGTTHTHASHKSPFGTGRGVIDVFRDFRVHGDRETLVRVP
ncbi:MAG: hypothetical protein BWY49_00529 [Candidatus Omnitrophica bacterium ADurb.Bin314]|nr:MAG: hypothetical protein BWY49_00529 [Candidatus Omnitrophica bacterium ADurb.Bin314]